MPLAQVLARRSSASPRVLTSLDRFVLTRDPQSSKSYSTFASSSSSSSKYALSLIRPSFDQKNHFFKTSTTSSTQVMWNSTSSKQDEQDPQETKKAVVKASSSDNTPGLDMGLKHLIPEWRNMFKSDTLLTDVSAGITVGCIAVPLSLAIALASGVPAEVGLVTAAVSGVAGGLMGGTTLAVTGPAAAISLLVVGAVQQHGLEALPFITLACGGLQLASGVARLGVVTKLVPVSVIAGFTTGVGTLILTGQLPKALGMTAPAGMNPVELLAYIGSNVSAVSPAAAALALGTSAAMFYLPKVHPKIPSALLAVGGATLLTHGMGLDVALIGNIPSGLSAFQFGIPGLPSVDSLPSLCATTLLIYGMTSVESLLSCAALEKMKKTTYKHNADQELVGQGLANMGAAMFMGMPVTSVIARSSLNVRLNANTRLPALVQAGFVFSSVVFFSDKISMIPMPALSGVLITTGMGMLIPKEFKDCYAVQKMDALPYATTVAGMITLGLAEGIGIGCASAVALNYYQAQQAKAAAAASGDSEGAASALQQVLQVQELRPLLLTGNDLQDSHLLQQHRGFHSDAYKQQEQRRIYHESHDIHPDNTVWKLNGPVNFLSMFVIDKMMARIKEHQADATHNHDEIVLDMEGVSTLEFTGVEELVVRLLEAADGTPLRMVHVSDDLKQALDLCDPGQLISRGEKQMAA